MEASNSVTSDHRAGASGRLVPCRLRSDPENVRPDALPAIRGRGVQRDAAFWHDTLTSCYSRCDDSPESSAECLTRG